MKQPVRNKILSYFLLVLATGYIGCVVFFTHIHIIDGVVIVHAHKTSDSIGDQHQHTSNELVLFHALSHYVASGSDIPQNYTFKERFCAFLVWNMNVDLSFPSHYYSHCQLRAPPFSLS